MKNIFMGITPVVGMDLTEKVISLASKYVIQEAGYAVLIYISLNILNPTTTFHLPESLTIAGLPMGLLNTMKKYQP